LVVDNQNDLGRYNNGLERGDTENDERAEKVERVGVTAQLSLTLPGKVTN